MAAWEGKKYKLDKSENFDEYMKALGVGLVLRKMGNTVSPTVELKKVCEGVYELITCSTFKSTTIQFKEGEELDEETLDGRKVKTTFEFDGANKLVQDQRGSTRTTIVREFNESCMIATMIFNDIKCVRTYKIVCC